MTNGPIDCGIGPEAQASGPFSVAAALLLCLLGALWISCEKGAPPPAQAPKASPRKNILLVTIDTWRWDCIGSSGTGRVQTPNLDRLASNGLYLKQVQTTCPLTTPAHASILTGLYPHRHGIRDNLHYRLREGARTLADLCKDKGYETLAVVSGAPLRRIYGLDRGFDQYDDTGLGKEGDNAFAPSQRIAGETTERALNLLRGASGDAPVFLWVHYYDPHSPYSPPEPFQSLFGKDPYAGEVAYVDSELGRLLDGLPGTLDKDWIVCITGDHGEALGDHGESTHGLTLYQSVLQVPLILHPAPDRPVDPPENPALIDVLPTLCGLSGMAPPAVDGRSLLVESPPDRWLAAESAYPTMAFHLNPIFALRRDGLIWFRHGAEEVYDLEEDPRQERNLAGKKEAERFQAECGKRLGGFFGEDPLREILTPSLSLARADMGSLEGLGYLGSGLPGKQGIQPMDLRPFLPEFEAFNRARTLFNRGDHEAALDGYTRFLGRFPGSYLAHQEMGSTLVSLGRYREAEAAYRKALQLDPMDSVSSLNLGNLMAVKGDFESAQGFYRSSLAAEEAQPEAHLNLGLLYFRHLNQPERARPHFQRFLQLSPDDPEAPAVREALLRIDAAP